MKNESLQNSQGLRGRPVLLRLSLMFLLAFFVSSVTMAQTAVSGKVTDENGIGMPGVNIIIKGTTNGTTSDSEGNYTLDVPSNDAVLVFSFIGYTTFEEPVNGRSSINVALQPSIQSLNEVVVIGYGTQKKSDVTGAISSISGSQIQEIPTAGLASAIQGRVAGVTVNQTSSRPGGGMEIRVRGERSLPRPSTLNTAQNNEPLLVVDGIPWSGNLNDINPNDIVSLDILKDASATAIYGSRGANGVIIITTRRGKAGAPKISYNAYYGVTTRLGEHDVMSGEEYGQFMVDANLTSFTSTEIESLAIGREVDWQDLVMKNGHITNHDLNLSGGTEATQYAVSLGYFDETTVLPGQGYDRYSLRAVVDQQIGERIKVGINSYNAYSRRSGENANPMFQLLTLSPLYTAYNDDGSINEQPAVGSLDPTIRNPLLLYRDDSWAQQRRRFRSFNSLYGEVEILDGLKYRLNVGLDFSQDKFGSFQGANTPMRNGGANTAQLDNNDQYGYTLENIVSYTRTFASVHTIDFTGLYSRQFQQNHNFSANVSDIPADYLLYYNMGLASSAPTVNGSEGSWGLESFMGRINYNMDSRYMLTLSARADGSSRLAEGNKWFFYYAAAAAWNVHNESFLQSVDAISNLKVRAGYGTVSNQAINPYSSLGSLQSIRYNYGAQNQIGYYPSNLPNPNLTWEFTNTLNLGVDLGIMDRVNLTFDWFTAKTTDVLQDRSLPIVSGVSTPITENIGSTESTGIEISLSADVLKNASGFNWNLSANYTQYRNEITSLSEGIDSNPGNWWFVGEDITAIYDYKKVGIWQLEENQTEEENALMNASGRVPGDVRVEDVDPNGIIDADDRTIIGHMRPDFEMGLTNRFSFKNFDLSVIAYYRHGGTLVSTLYASNQAEPYNTLEGRRSGPSVNYWTPTNPSNEYPRTGTQQPAHGSTLGYFDATYLKIRNITLGYTLPKSIGDNLGLASTRVYFMVNNPFKAMLSDFVDAGGLDPEPTGRGAAGNLAGIGQRLTVRPDTPPTRQFIFGVNLSF